MAAAVWAIIKRHHIVMIGNAQVNISDLVMSHSLYYLLCSIFFFIFKGTGISIPSIFVSKLSKHLLEIEASIVLALVSVGLAYIV